MPDTSDRMLTSLLKQLRTTTDLDEVRRLSEKIERVVFHKQFEHAWNPAASSCRDHESPAGTVSRWAKRHRGLHGTQTPAGIGHRRSRGNVVQALAKFTLAGDGEMPKTFLSPEMIARGKEIH